MESCKYHPDTPSNFQCEHCQEDLCTDCVDHSVGGEARCFKCGTLLTLRVTEDSVEPFAKRLEKAFRYPLTSTSMVFVIGLSVATTVLAAMPLSGLIRLIAFLFFTGLALNYSFLCLKATAEGEMTPPDLNEALAGSFTILFRLFAMSLLIGWGVNAIGTYVSPVLETLAMIILFVGLPAILMSFAMTDSILESINPLTFIRLMTTIGIPYLVLVMFLFIMVSSVSLLNSIIGHNLLVLSAILQSSTSYYYSMVAFHLMGYLLYQYQDRLGIATTDADNALLPCATPAEVAMAHANIRLKEGDYKRTVALLQNAITTEPQNARLWQRYFDVLYRLGDKAALKTTADQYLNHLFELAQNDRLLTDFKKLRALLPNYLPGYAHLRLQLASQYHGRGDAKTTIQLINGLHKQFPDFDQLVPAYTLMAQALSDMPNMETQVVKCQQLISQLKKKFPEQEMLIKQDTKASFHAEEAIMEKHKPVFAVEEPEPGNKPEDKNDPDKPIEFISSKSFPIN